MVSKSEKHSLLCELRSARDKLVAKRDSIEKEIEGKNILIEMLELEENE